MSNVEQIKERLAITDVVSAYIKLEKAGANFKALCPFHHEKTASFFISPGRGTYYCFGCGVKGDVFSFVEAFEGVDFLGALKILALKAGVELLPRDPKAHGEKERLYLCLESAVSYFKENLYKTENELVLRYLEARGLTQETIKDWEIGYAPMAWHGVHAYLTDKKFTDDEILKAGLIKIPEEKGRVSISRFYDRFRDRIMFPLKDSGGRTVGFSGRIFKEDGKSAKYINSPETLLYVKSKILYGLDKAKSAIREKEEVVLVEGQMDILLSHQVGVKHVVALSGTALTPEHVLLLHRFSRKIIFAFDPDSAGVRAARKSAMAALEDGMEVKVALLPKGEDPADCIAKNKFAWEEALATSLHIIYFSLENILSLKIDSQKLIQEIHNNIFPFLFSLQSSMEKSFFVREISKRTGIREEAILEDYKKEEKKFDKKHEKEETLGADGEKQIKQPRRYSVERRIYGIVVWQESLKEPVLETLSVRERLKNIVGDENFKKIDETFSPVKNELIIETEVLYEASNMILDLAELFSHLEEDYAKEALAREIEKLSKAERSTDKAHVKEILETCRMLSERLSKLSAIK